MLVPALTLLLSGCAEDRGTALTLPKPKSLQFENQLFDRVQQREPRKGADYTLEYLPAGQTRKNWRDIITEQYFVTPEGIADPALSPEHIPIRFLTLYERKLRANHILADFSSNLTPKGMQIYWHGIVIDAPKLRRKQGQQARSRAQDAQGHWHFAKEANDLAGSFKEFVYNIWRPPTAADVYNRETSVVLVTNDAEGMHVWQYARRGDALAPESISQHKLEGDDVPRELLWSESDRSRLFNQLSSFN